MNNSDKNKPGWFPTPAILKIHLVWAMIDGNPWLVDSWDDGNVDEDPKLYQARLNELRVEHGEDNVRVQIASIPLTSVEALFTPPEITL